MLLLSLTPQQGQAKKQASGRRDDFRPGESRKPSLEDRTEWDDKYVEIRSSRVDARILLATVGTVFSLSGDVTQAPPEE